MEFRAYLGPKKPAFIGFLDKVLDLISLIHVRKKVNFFGVQVRLRFGTYHRV